MAISKVAIDGFHVINAFRHGANKALSSIGKAEGKAANNVASKGVNAVSNVVNKGVNVAKNVENAAAQELDEVKSTLEATQKLLGRSNLHKWIATASIPVVGAGAYYVGQSKNK